MHLNTIRHAKVFSPRDFAAAGHRVDIIGCGATGSRIALSLAKLGIMNLHVWDFDRIESHNISNQSFIGGEADIGRYKTEVIRELILGATGTEVQIHTEKVDGTQELGDIVFLLTDTMASRKLIWDGSLKFNLDRQLMIETRMGVETGKVYSINPSRLSHINGWEKTLCEDKPVNASACGTVTSVGPTAEIISGLASWQLMYWFQQQQGAEVDLANEIMFCLRPFRMTSRTFS